MITQMDLQEAIAECNGKRNPDANTCLKLAAYYTIQDHLFERTIEPVMPMQSFSSAPDDKIHWEGDSEFAQIVSEQPVSHIMPIMDELMETIRIIQPKLYAGVMRKIKEGL